MYKEENVFLASIKERYCLNPGSAAETYHLVIDLSNTSIEYSVGDCLGIYAENDPISVQSVLQQLKAHESELIEDRKGNSHFLGDFLTKYAGLHRLPSVEGLSLTQFCQHLPPLLPRFYSIASSMHAVGKEAHLTVRLVEGLCSHHLCKKLDLGKAELPIFHHPARQFGLLEHSHDKPIVMIGPGTGIAPFLGFMQERISKKSSTKNWLFFGERFSQTDFYYQKYWENLVFSQQLELDCAFSRDQSEKVYVQHKMWEKSTQLWQWIQEGAFLFVCGDASKMAKEVDRTLHAIVEKEGGLTTQEAKIFIKELKKSQRYQRDVY